MSENFPEKLLTWYAENTRDLPWRGMSDPYAVLVSEVMLQQTRVTAVIPYFERWMARFPTLQSLAEASQEEVLSLWEGLGYYRRARALHRAAGMVMEDYGGTLPGDAQTLRTLPGIGRYTAAALASIAFGADEPALDGNIRRVLSRFFNVTIPIHTSAGEKRLWALAGEHLPAHASRYNQALMDLGALVCTSRTPNCSRCPVKGGCQARVLGIQEERPVRKAKSPIPHHTVTAAVIPQAGRVLIARRPPDGLLGGMWEFPGGTQEAGESLSACLRREIQEELGVEIAVGETLGVYDHAYTHFRITLHAFQCQLVTEEIQLREHTDWKWAGVGELDGYPMGKIDRQIARYLQRNQ
ncbi:MAG: Adenine DNA glycosylase [Chloroflexi bacterium]|nr:Adenine DNA glycosylase [Chloroflexota bacterium]